MKWQLIDPYHLKSGPWTITKPGRLDGLPKPYGVWLGGKLLGNFKTSEDAKGFVDEKATAK